MRFLGGRRNVLYNTWLAGSIADAFRSEIAFSKNRQFFGVFGYFWHSHNRGISRIPKLGQYFDSHSTTKNESGGRTSYDNTTVLGSKPA